MVFSKYFNGLDDIQLDDILKHLKVPKQWIDKLIERNFTKDEINKIKSLGGLDKLMEELKKRIEEQKKRHILRAWVSPDNNRAIDPLFKDNYGDYRAGFVRGGMKASEN